MRQPKEQKSKVDIKKPVHLPADKDGGCFGVEWDMTTNECSLCADNIVCGIVYGQTTLKNNVQKVVAEKGHFLDETDFDGITKEQITTFIAEKNFMLAEPVLTTAALIQYVEELSKCNDRVAVVNWLQNFVSDNKEIVIKKGIVWLKQI